MAHSYKQKQPLEIPGAAFGEDLAQFMFQGSP